MSKIKLKVGDRVMPRNTAEASIMKVSDTEVGTVLGSSGDFIDVEWDSGEVVGGRMTSRFKIAKPKKPAPRKQDYRGNGKHAWEPVTEDKNLGDTLRLRVPGGWYYVNSFNAGGVFVPLPVVDKRPI